MIYSEIIKSKTGYDIPLFLNSHPMYSKYNFENEVNIFAKEITADFIIILGLGAGYHIKKVLENKPDSKFIIIEADSESLDFCSNFDCVKELKNNKNLIFCSAENFTQYLPLYQPAIYKKLSIVSYRSWENENKEISTQIKNILLSFIQNVKSDYSVQSHFGRIWNRNILLNYKFYFNKSNVIDITYKKNLTAAIIAAGPSLDSSITKLKKFRSNYFIISTDTALNSLLGSDIYPNAVISIDGQHISSTHFMNLPSSEKNKIHFIFDLCSNPEAINKILTTGHSLQFIKNNHPLSNILKGTENLQNIESGSGTVTIAAADWARQNGFKTLEFFGADFAYIQKPYAKGTYLDCNFSQIQNRFESLEQKHDALIFRTELIKIENNMFNQKLAKNSYTSPTLKSYGETLFLWAKKYNFKINENIFSTSDDFTPGFQKNENIKTKENLENYFLNLKNLLNLKKEDLLSNKYFYTLLPLIAWLRENNTDADNLSDFVKLAYNECLRYN